MQIDPRFAPGRDPFAARRGAMAGLPSYSGPAYPYGPSQVSPAQIAPPAATEALTYGRTPLGYVPEDPRFGPSGPQRILPDGGVMQPMGPAGDPTGQFPYGTVNY